MSYSDNFDDEEVDENDAFFGMSPTEVLMLKRRELDTLYAEIKVLDEMIPVTDKDGREGGIVSESEAYAIIMDLRAQNKMCRQEVEALRDEKRVQDKLLRTKDSALIQLTEELRKSNERLLDADSKLKTTFSRVQNESSMEKQQFQAELTAQKGKLEDKWRKSQLEQAWRHKTEPDDPDDPFFDAFKTLKDQINQHKKELDTLSKHVRLLNNESRRKDRHLASMGQELRAAQKMEIELNESKFQVDRLTRELKEARSLYEKLSEAASSMEPGSPRTEQLMAEMDVAGLQEELRGKIRVIRVLEEENSALRSKQVEIEIGQADSGTVPLEEASASVSLRDYQDRRLLQVEVRKLREAREVQDRTIKSQQGRINMLSSRLEFIGSSLREASVSHRQASDTAPSPGAGVPTPAEFRAAAEAAGQVPLAGPRSVKDKGNDRATASAAEGAEWGLEDVVPAPLYDLVVSQLSFARRQSAEAIESVTEKQVVIENLERNIAVLKHAKNSVEEKARMKEAELRAAAMASTGRSPRSVGRGVRPGVRPLL